jgi:hypothetical protein
MCFLQHLGSLCRSLQQILSLDSHELVTTAFRADKRVLAGVWLTQSSLVG